VVKPYNDAAASAHQKLDTLPKVNILWRNWQGKPSDTDHSIHADLQPYQKGRMVEEPAFLSTAQEEGGAAGFRGPGSFRTKSMARTKAKVIERFAIIEDLDKLKKGDKSEAEAIFPPGTRFLVTKREPQDASKVLKEKERPYKIEMEEMK